MPAIPDQVDPRSLELTVSSQNPIDVNPEQAVPINPVLDEPSTSELSERGSCESIESEELSDETSQLSVESLGRTVRQVKIPKKFCDSVFHDDFESSF